MSRTKLFRGCGTLKVMKYKMWTYDLAREQAPSLEHLRRICQLTVDSGFNALGLYLEHRYAYPSTPWAHGTGALTPDLAAQIVEEFPQIQIIPFVNVLGHMEGFLYTERGKRFAEARFKGLQACPLCEGLHELCLGMINDVLEVFKSEMVHLGGDETAMLGLCEKCAEKVAAENEKGRDGKAVLYGEYFKPLIDHVASKGKVPGMWADMFFEHPEALEIIPSNTVLFDWQYFNGPEETTKKLTKTHQVVTCPALHTYNACWFHMEKSQENLLQHLAAVDELGSSGVCLTTWELGLFGNYETMFPALRAAGKMMNGVETDFLSEYALESEQHKDWAQMVAIDLQALGGYAFSYSTIRSSLKCRLLLQGNPFLAWKHHAEEFAGDKALPALEIVERSLAAAPNASYRAVSSFIKAGIEFVRLAEQARQSYAEGLPGVALACLAPCRQIFDDLEKMATANYHNIGGSLADIERCKIARRHVEVVILRIKEYGDGSLGYLPSFEHLTHHNFVPHDQACWWRINQWSRE